MNDGLLVINAGSSSIKFSLFRAASGAVPERLLRGEVASLADAPRLRVQHCSDGEQEDRALGAGAMDHARALDRILDWLAGQGPLAALRGAGHRIVHGGCEFAEPVLATEPVVEAVSRWTPLAPLHQPHNLAAVQALRRIRPDLPQVLCFDTAFHRSQPPVAQVFALPRALQARGIRRYGFHGLSYEYVATVLPGIAGAAARGRVVVAHLGNGASLCALRAGRSVASSMGFTALDGLPMGTRCGALDPGVVLYLMAEEGMSVAEVSRLLYEESGLLGVSGISGDMRTLLADDSAEAAEAIDLFVYRIGRELGSMVAALGGLDALVFTGGIGENAAIIRARVIEDGAWLGLRLDPEANLSHGPRITGPDSVATAWVVATDEEAMIARHSLAALSAGT